MVANQAQAFAQIIDFYTGLGKAHLPEIHRLAKLDTPKSDETLLHYVMEAIRINGSLGAYRKCKKDTSIPDKNTPGGKRELKEGDNVFVSFVDIAKDEAVYPNPHVVDLTRPIDSYIVYGVGPHKCLGGSASTVALTAMLKVVGRLHNLRAAPGPQGTLKKIPREGGFYVYMDEFQGGYTPFPASLKIQWDEVKNEDFPTDDWMWAYVG
jgi:linoleate 10R-lipoxygenase